MIARPPHHPEHKRPADAARTRPRPTMASAPAAHQVLALQRAVGNQAVQRLLRRPAPAPSAALQRAPDPGHEPGSPRIVEDYPIRPGSEDRLIRAIDTERRTVGDVNYPPTYEDKSVRILTRSGLRAHLSMLAHGPLSAFEESLVADWGTDPMARLTPLLPIGGQGVYGYILDSGGSGLRTRTFYSPVGHKIRQFQSEVPLVNMGLGPIDYIMLATAAAALGRYALRRFLAKRGVAVGGDRVVKEFLDESEGVLAVIHEGRILARSRNLSLNHPEFVSRHFPGGLPKGAEVVTIGKHHGDVGAVLSASFHGGARIASPSAQEAVKRAYR